MSSFLTVSLEGMVHIEKVLQIHPLTPLTSTFMGTTHLQIGVFLLGTISAQCCQVLGPSLSRQLVPWESS